VAEDGDVAALMCHAERDEVVAWLRSRGAVADDPDAVRRKVVRARGEHEAEDEIARLWEVEDAEERCRGGAELYAAHAGDARIAYEYAGTHDSAGHEADAVPLYEEALRLGLREPLRHRAQLQLASSLRNLGRHDQALAVVEDVASRYPESVGVAAFRALVTHDAGAPTQALRDLLATVVSTSTDQDVERYRRALTAYATALGR
jgi:cyanophycin synthetase